MRTKSILLLLAIFFITPCISCKKPGIEIHQLSDFSYLEESETYSGEKYRIKNEFFVISNMPDRKLDIEKAVKKFNSVTLSDSELREHYGLLRRFYKESEHTPINYKETTNGYFVRDRLEHHGEDLVLVVKWTEFGNIEEYLFQ